MNIVLTQPNYSWLGQRAWEIPPYTLALLNACLGGKAELYDPNFKDTSIENAYRYFQEEKPDIVGVSSISTEYIDVGRLMTKTIKEASPDSIVIQGGVIPTVVKEIAMQDPNVDCWVAGEGEFRLPQVIQNGQLGYIEREDFINDLDSIPFPDYGNLNPLDYGEKILKFSQGLLPRKFPYAVMITSRGCPFRCIFCAAATVSGKKIRYRSAENVLEEIAQLYKIGIREIIFLDDHFLGNRKRAIQIMRGMCKYDLSWKCVNVAVWSLDEEVLQVMKDSGCSQMTISIESGNQDILNNIIKKPVDLKKAPVVIDMAKKMGFEIIANFVIGFPGETWEQIRETTRYAESVNVDLANFHIATPLPHTELMRMCLEGGYLSDEVKTNTSGYTKGVISTKDFTSSELEILRAYEWDRINFSTPERRETVARMQGISLSELEDRRVKTRRKWGVNVSTREECLKS